MIYPDQFHVFILFPKYLAQLERLLSLQIVFLILSVIVGPVSNAEELTYPDTKEVSLNYRDIKVSAGAIFKTKPSKDNPDQTPLFYRLTVTHWFIRDGGPIGTSIFKKELLLDEIDYDAIRGRSINEIIHYDAQAKRVDFYLHSYTEQPTVSYTIEEDKLRPKGNLRVSDSEIGYRKWTSIANSFIEARYIERRGDIITLARRDDSRINVTYSQFAPEDQNLIDRMSGHVTGMSAEARAELVKKLNALSARAIVGDLSAIDEISRISDELYEDIDGDDGSKIVKNMVLFTPIFGTIGEACSEASPLAFGALTYSLDKKRLRSFAIQNGMGVAARRGYLPALEFLTNYSLTGLNRADATRALVPAARARIPQALEFMLKVTATEKNKGLQRYAAIGLEPAALAGDEAALNALKRYQQTYGPDKEITAGR
jgi:hypothetical protein